MVKVYISGTDDMRMGETSYGDDKGRYVYRKITNADRIRAMSDEELAKEINEIGDVIYTAGRNRFDLLSWLQQEVE